MFFKFIQVDQFSKSTIEFLPDTTFESIDSFFSFDTSFTNKKLLESLRVQKVTILAGIWSTTDLSVIDDIKPTFKGTICWLEAAVKFEEFFCLMCPI